MFERIKTLANELTADPLARGYSGMTDQQAADSLNAKDRTRTRTSVPTSGVFEATTLSDYAALSAENKTLYQSMLAMGTLDPSGINTRAVFGSLFPSGTTRANLLALQDESVSRGVELGLTGTVDAGAVTRARAYTP